jgi:hypothetical protein
MKLATVGARCSLERGREGRQSRGSLAAPAVQAGV